MRFLVTLVLSGSLIFGCGEDGSDNPRSTCLTTGPVNPGGSPPEMANIAWDPLGFCQQGAFNNYNVFVFASDSDSPLLELTFDVNVPGCSPVAHLANQIGRVSDHHNGATLSLESSDLTHALALKTLVADREHFVD